MIYATFRPWWYFFWVIFLTTQKMRWCEFWLWSNDQHENEIMSIIINNPIHGFFAVIVDRYAYALQSSSTIWRTDGNKSLNFAHTFAINSHLLSSSTSTSGNEPVVSVIAGKYVVEIAWWEPYPIMRRGIAQLEFDRGHCPPKQKAFCCRCWQFFRRFEFYLWTVSSWNW